MNSKDFQAAMLLYAEADERATASLIEHIAAICLLKLNPPARGDDVVSVDFSTAEIAEMLTTHSVESRYSDEGVATIFITPLNLPRAQG